MTATIFDIKRYSINDGPGIRVTIFFKGCPLRCLWCHNPESFSARIEKMYNATKCIGAQACIEVCPYDALTLTKDGVVTDWKKCTLCGKCADVCPTKAIEMTGYQGTIENIMAEIEKERIIIDQSGGGVTFSGGEPMQQYPFLVKLLDACGKSGFHRTVDTTGYTETIKLLDIASRTELFLYDLKHMDPIQHQKYTGVSNELILSNLQELAKTGANINIRIPFVGGVNTDEENVTRSAEFIAALEGEKKVVNILSYHNIAGNKYKKLGKAFDQGELREPTNEEMYRATAIFGKYGLETIFGG